MSFRPATADDEVRFYYWRRFSEVRGYDGGWYEGPRTQRDEHRAWYADRLTRVTLLVWEDDSIAGRGVVRVDSNGELAFDATHPRSMLEALLAYWTGGRLKVTVDEPDWIKAQALKAAGFVEHPVRFFCWRP